MKDVKTIVKIAEKIYKKIVENLTDRRGLKHEWESIDKNILDEIKSSWINIIIKQLNKEKL